MTVRLTRRFIRRIDGIKLKYGMPEYETLKGEILKHEKLRNTDHRNKKTDLKET